MTDKQATLNTTLLLVVGRYHRFDFDTILIRCWQNIVLSALHNTVLL